MSSTDKFISGVLIGGVIGAVVALLNAPRAGKETRKRIRQNLESQSESARAYVEESLDNVKTAVKDNAGEFSQRVEATASKLEATGREAVSQIKSSADKLAKRGSDASKN